MKRILHVSVMAIAFTAMSAVPVFGYDSMRIMSFNICHCATHYSLSITDEDVQRTASVIAAENPDFVCLQEVDDKTTRSNGIDETARLAELTGMYGTFGKARDYQGGGYGVAILSRQEPLSVSTRTVEGNEARLLLICEFDDYYIATIHFDNNRDLRLASIPTVRDALAALDKPVFISGDWNATPSSETLDAMREFVTIVSPQSGVRTFGDFEGDDYVIDYIAVDTKDADMFFVKRGYCVSNVVNGEGSSDHNPVIVDVVKRPNELGWVEENAVTTGLTGKWSNDVVYDKETQVAELGGVNAFSSTTPSGGNVVTMTTTMTFDCVPQEEVQPKEGAQGGLWIGTNGCFQVWTRGKLGVGSGGVGELGWVDVEAGGVTPEVGVEYTFRFTFDYTSKTYGVEVQTATGFTRLREKNPVNPVNPVQNFPLATPGSKISRIRFDGSGAFRSLVGEWAEKAKGMCILLR